MRTEFTKEQIGMIVKAIQNDIPPGKLYKTHDFENIHIRTFYRKYRDEALKLGVYRANNRWSEDDERKLKTMPEDVLKNAEDFNGWQRQQVRKKCNELGIEVDRKYPLWTKEEDERLLEVTKTKSPRQIFEEGIFPNRSMASIYSRIKMLCSDKKMEKAPWTKEEEDSLLELGKSMSIKELQEKFPGRSYSAIQTKLIYLKKRGN